MTNTVPPPSIALTFVATALLCLGATFAWMALESAPLLAVLHALVVGVFLTTAMGLLYQFIPVVAMAPLRFARLPFVHAALAIAGTALLVYGFARGDFALVRSGGSAHLAGIAIEVFVLASTVRRGKPPAAARGALLSVVWLLATVILGITIANLFANGRSTGMLIDYHALFGLGGFFGTIIAAITFRLLRMFERVDRQAKTMAVTIGTGIATLCAAFVRHLGSYVLLLAAAAFAFMIGGIARVRNPAYQRETLWYAGVSALGAVAAATAFALNEESSAIFYAVWFFVGTAVIGYLQRIVPFIWWIRRSHREGARNIPTLGEMNQSPLGFAILAGWVSAGLLWVVFPEKSIAPIAALCTWVALLVQLARPFVLRKRLA